MDKHFIFGVLDKLKENTVTCKLHIYRMIADIKIAAEEESYAN